MTMNAYGSNESDSGRAYKRAYNAKRTKGNETTIFLDSISIISPKVILICTMCTVYEIKVLAPFCLSFMFMQSSLRVLFAIKDHFFL